MAQDFLECREFLGVDLLEFEEGARVLGIEQRSDELGVRS